MAGFAVMFGVIGGAAFQGSSYLTGKILGVVNKDTVDKTKTVSNAQLTSSKTTVTSDVSEIVENTIPSIVSITNMSVQQVQSFLERSVKDRRKVQDQVLLSARMIRNFYL